MNPNTEFAFIWWSLFKTIFELILLIEYLHFFPDSILFSISLIEFMPTFSVSKETQHMERRFNFKMSSQVLYTYFKKTMCYVLKKIFNFYYPL